jgi:DNA-nicking Smr family endonuclease
VKLRSLQALDPVKQALQQRKAQADAQQRARVQAEAEAQYEQHLFLHTVGAVHSITSTQRSNTRPAPVAPEPRQRINDERAALEESLSDDFDVDSLLETDESLFYRRVGIDLSAVRKLRRGEWAIQGQIDLHGLRREQAREQLGQWLRAAHQKGWRCVRVIHGKGHGSPGREPVLKSKVRSWLVQKQEVLAFVQARACDGGTGALMVLLNSST